MLATGSLLAAALLPLRLLVLIALTATDAAGTLEKKIYWSCCCAHKDTALPDGETPWP